MTLQYGLAQDLGAVLLSGLHSSCQETEAYSQSLSQWCLNAKDYLQGQYYESDIGQYAEYSERVPECGLELVRTENTPSSFLSGSYPVEAMFTKKVPRRGYLALKSC